MEGKRPTLSTLFYGKRGELVEKNGCEEVIFSKKKITYEKTFVYLHPKKMK